MASNFLFSQNSTEQDLEHFSFNEIHLHKNIMTFCWQNFQLNFLIKMSFHETKYELKAFPTERLSGKFHTGEQGKAWKINRIGSHYSSNFSNGLISFCNLLTERLNSFCFGIKRTKYSSKIWPLFCNSDDDIFHAPKSVVIHIGLLLQSILVI